METSKKMKRAQGITQSLMEADKSRMSLLASIVESSEDAIIGKTPEGVINSWNPAAERIFGYKAEEIIGKPISILLSPDRPNEMDEILGKIRMGERVEHYDTVRRCKDGSDIHVSITVSPIYDSRGRLIGVSSIKRDITARKREEVEREQTLLQLEAVLESIHEGVVISNLEGNVLTMNKEALALHGYESIKRVRRPLSEYQETFELFDLEGRPIPFEEWPMMRALRGERFADYEVRFRRNDTGSVKIASYNGTLVHNKTGEAILAVITVRDITERKRMEEALRIAKVQLQMIADIMPIGVARCSRDRQYLWVSAEYARWVGRLPEEIVGHSVAEVLGEEADEAIVPYVERVMTGQKVAYEAGINFKGLGLRWITATYMPTYDHEGIPDGWVSVVIDITYRKEMEEKLRRSEENFYKGFKLAPIGITLSTLSDGRFIEINEAGERLSGYRRDEVIGRNATEFSIWRDPMERDQVIREVLDKGEVREREMTMRDKAGRVFCGLFSGVVVEIRGEKHLLSLVSDIGERKRAQEALRESEERFRLLADAAPVMIWEAGPDGLLTFVNKPWLEFLGRNMEQELGLGWVQSVHPDDLDRCMDTYLSACKDRRSFSMEYRLRRADGGYSWLADTGVPRLAPDGELLGYIGTCFDITERNRLREELQQANELLVQRVAERTAELSETIERLKDEINERIRIGLALQAETAERLNAQAELREKELLLLHQSRLAALGEMIGNIAHQWRQPLNLLGLLAQDLSMTYKKGAFNTEYLEANVKKVLETIRHMSQTIDDFRYFFRPDKEKVNFRILEMIEKTISLLEGTLKEQQIRTAVASACDPVVNGYPNEFSQVILNIMINARDAFVTQKVTNPTITIEIGTAGGKCVVTITDNAGGIPEETIDKIFAPYFTTKGPDKGTGVGLFMSKTIIEKNMGGSLSARNVNGGAQFRIVV